MRTSTAFLAALSFCFSTSLYAQQPVANSVDVITKPGHSFGRAVAHIEGKPKDKPQLITRRATHAWLADQQHSVVVIAPPEKNHPKPQLRIFDIDSGERHTLGEIALSNPEFLEIQNGDDPSVFLLKGEEDGKPALYLADRTAIHARILNASRATVTGDSLNFYRDDKRISIPVKAALGTDLINNIYTVDSRTFQLLSDGSAVILADDKRQTATWLTDGDDIFLRAGSLTSTIPQSSLHEQKGVPAETRLTLRLLQPLDSRTNKAGQAVEAALIIPAVVDGNIYLPQDTTFHGTLTKVHAVHYGFGREVAAITLHFDHAQIPNGPNLAIDARIVQVENSRESVDKTGAIKGQRATGTLGSSAQGQITSLSQIDPIAYIALTADGIAILGFAESEILYPAGTEMIATLNKPLLTTTTYPRRTAREATIDQVDLQPFLQTLPFRTTTQLGDHPSDLTSIVFLGNPDALQRAFTAAGWVTADSLTAASTFSTLRSISGTQTYNEAPMSTLLLDKKEPLTTLTKTTNTFNARHHLRIFPTGKTFDGHTVLTASTTQDTGIAFSRKKKTFIHVIDQYIDNERSKVINDLIYTHCVDAVQMVPRPWVPRDAYNSTGDRLRTDGDVAVLRLNDCTAPKTTTPTPAIRPNKFERTVRNTMLTVRNQLYRGNLVYQGIDYSRKAFTFLSEHDAPANLGTWYRTEASNVDDEQDPNNIGRPQTHPAKVVMEKDTTTPVNRWAPPRYEIALHGGYIRFRNPSLEQTAILLAPNANSSPSDPLFLLGLADELGDGWTAGFSVTVNSWKYVSNEFSYFRQQGKYRLGAFDATIPQCDTPGTPNCDDIDDIGFDSGTATIGIITRQFEYNTLVHLRPPTSRWRPYIAAGPVLQLIALDEAPLKKPSGYYSIGLKNIGLLQAAFDFGRTPPLDGGGIFQPGLQYGAGMKYRVTPRFTMRMDWRETWSRNPQIIRTSYEDFQPDDLPSNYDVYVFNEKPDHSFFQQRATIGFAFTF